MKLGEYLATELPLAAVGATNKIALVINDFTPDEDLTWADFTLADFDGSAALASPLGAQQFATDPLTGEQMVTMIEPAGGWRWETTGLTNLPQTVYGYILIDTLAAPDELLGITKLDTPIPLTVIGQEINIGAAQFRFSQEPIA